MRYKSTTGLPGEKLTELIARAWQVHQDRPADERENFEVPFGRQVTIVLCIARHNLRQRLTADLFGVSQATISRIWRYILPLLGLVTCMDRISLTEALKEGMLLLEGTFIPTGNRLHTGRTNYSGKHHLQCLNIQVLARPDATLAAVSTPVAGAPHDSKAVELAGWATELAAAIAAADLDLIADTAYTKHTDLTPIKRKKGQQRTDEERQFNPAIAHTRTPVEHTIALLKQWRTLADGHRGPLTELPSAIHIITNLELYRLTA